jgi:hypothetical protein
MQVNQTIEERLAAVESTLEIMRLKATYAECADGKYTEDHEKKPTPERDMVARQQVACFTEDGEFDAGAFAQSRVTPTCSRISEPNRSCSRCTSSPTRCLISTRRPALQKDAGYITCSSPRMIPAARCTAWATRSTTTVGSTESGYSVGWRRG